MTRPVRALSALAGWLLATGCTALPPDAPAAFVIGNEGAGAWAPPAASAPGARANPSPVAPVTVGAAPLPAPIAAAGPTAAADAGAHGVPVPVPMPMATPTPLPANGAYLLDATGRVVPVTPGSAIAVPAGLVGSVSLFEPGWQPSTVELPAGDLVLHPAIAAVAPAPTGTATLSGTVAGAGAGLAVQYLSANRRLFAGGQTDAAGAFSFAVPLDGSEPGLVVARDGGLLPAIAVARVSLSAGATASASLPAPVAASAGSYATLNLGTGSRGGLPQMPAGLNYSAAALQLAETGPTAPWRASLLALSSPLLPSYPLPGFTQLHAFLASSPDGSRASETAGPPGAVPDGLQPPDAAAIAEPLVAGSTLEWPAVPGASLYTVRLTPVGQSVPVWEGACVQARLRVPRAIVAGPTELVLELHAWDAPELSIYSVASLGPARALRVPDRPLQVAGRHAWSRRQLHVTP